MAGCPGWCGRAGALRATLGRSHAVTPPSALSHPFPGCTFRLSSLQEAFRTLQPAPQQGKLPSVRIVLPPLYGHFVLSGMESLSLSLRLDFSLV